MRFLFVVTFLLAPVNNIQPSSVVTGKQEWVPFALLSSYKVFRTAVNNTNVLTSSCKVANVEFLDRLS
jgi:hypothetical protein